MYNKPAVTLKRHRRCKRCNGRAPQARFARLITTGRYDDLCIDCRFAIIDENASNTAAIRRDMIATGIPIGVARKRNNW